MTREKFRDWGVVWLRISVLFALPFLIVIVVSFGFVTGLLTWMIGSVLWIGLAATCAWIDGAFDESLRRRAAARTPISAATPEPGPSER